MHTTTALIENGSTQDLVQMLLKHSLQMQMQVSAMGQKIDTMAESLKFALDRCNRLEQDLFMLGDPHSIIRKPSPFCLNTQHPLAVESHDHLFPLGTAQDNTRYPRFVQRCEELLGAPLRFLDLGCAGGGLVLDFLLKGHEAFGLEGSDYPRKNQLFQWKWLVDRLQTCDITKNFSITDRFGGIATFNVISMWEVLEHIEERNLPQLLDNVRRHLADKALFCASIATFECNDPATGAVWHVTIKPREWWWKKFNDAGLEVVDGLFAVRDFPRGSGNGSQDWDALREPNVGFHLIARKRS